MKKPHQPRGPRSAVTPLLIAVALFLTLTSSSAGGRQWNNSEIEDLKTKVDNLVDALANAKQMTEDLSASGLKDRLREQLDQIRDLLNKQEAGSGDFVDSSGVCLPECEMFRDNLIQFFTNFEELTNEALSFQDSRQVGIVVSFERLKNILVDLPPLVLYPLYLGLNREWSVLDQDFVDALGTCVEDLRIIGDGFDLECSTINQDPDLYQNSATAATAFGSVLTLVGKGLEAKGKTGVTGKPVQIHGYVGIEIQTDWVGTIGSVFSGLGGSLGKVSSFLHVKLRHCALIQGQEMLMAQHRMLMDEHQQILGNQEMLLARQLEVLRLLHTPQGRRATGVPACDGRPCSWPETGNSGSGPPPGLPPVLVLDGGIQYVSPDAGGGAGGG